MIAARARRPLTPGFLRWGLDLRPVRLALAGGIACSVLRAVLAWTAPVPIKLIFDNVLSHHRLPALLVWLPAGRQDRLAVLSGAMVLIAILLGLTGYGANALLGAAAQRVVYDLRCRLFSHLQAQSLAFHQRHPVGDLLSRLGGDVQAMQSAVVNVLPVAVENTLTVVGMLGIMLVLDWRFSLLALGLLPVLLAVVRHYLAAIRSAQRLARRNEGLATSVAEQTLTALPVVQAFGGERSEAGRYGDLAVAGLSANRRAVLLQARFTPLVSVLMTLSIALVLFLGTDQVLRGRLTAGDLLVFTAYFRGMYGPARQLAKLAGTMGRGHASAERVNALLRMHEEVPRRPGARSRPAVAGTLTFDQVDFRHPGAGPVLHRVDLQVSAGTRHALVGATGSGKSTLLRLVPRFADPDRGAVRLDGVDLRDLDLDWLRRQVALVPQELALLRPTVWENVVYGSPWAARSDAVAAARAAGVHEVLADLSEGYLTEVGERGCRLSGGQRQCVAMARAMARDAPILLLDEPTTGLDAATEAVVVDALHRVADGRTTLLVSHQLAAVHGADRITVLADGRVVEQGTHQDLLAARTAYWRLRAEPAGGRR